MVNDTKYILFFMPTYICTILACTFVSQFDVSEVEVYWCPECAPKTLQEANTALKIGATKIKKRNKVEIEKLMK